MFMTCNNWARSDKVANTPPFLKHSLSPSRCREELSRIPRCLKILDHAGISTAVASVDLNKIEEAGVVDVVVVAGGKVVAGMVDVAAVSDLSLIKESIWGHVTHPPLSAFLLPSRGCTSHCWWKEWLPRLGATNRTECPCNFPLK